MAKTHNILKINQLQGLNRKARIFLLANCVSKRGVEVMAWGFNGFLNGNDVQNLTLIRENGKWIVFNTKELILSLKGIINYFQTTKNTI